MALSFFRKSASADLILRNANIFTAIPGAPFHGAIACLEGRITAVGEFEAVEALAGSDTQIVDLGGRYVIPGLIELGGRAVMDVFAGKYLDLSGCRSFDDLSDRLTFWAASHMDDDILFGYGYDESIFEGRLPFAADDADAEDTTGEKARERIEETVAKTVALLDRICDDRPLLLLCESGVSCLMNSEAQDIVNEAADEEGVSQITTPYVLDLLLPFDFEEIFDDTQTRIRRSLRAGFTSSLSLGAPDYFDSLYLDALIGLYNEEELDQRFYSGMMLNRPLFPRWVIHNLRLKKTLCSEIDGMINAEMLNLKLDNESSPFEFSQDSLNSILEETADKGFSILIEAAGRGDMEMAFRALEHVRSRGYKVPFTIVSAWSPQEIASELVYAESAVFLEPARLADASCLEDPARLADASRLKDPTRLADAAPLAEAPEAEAYLERMTATAAAVIGAEDALGTLEKGKYADAAVYDQNPLSMSMREFADAVPYMIIVNGKIVLSSMMEVIK